MTTETTTFALFKNGSQIGVRRKSWSMAMLDAELHDEGNYEIAEGRGHLKIGYEIKEMDDAGI